MSGKSAGPGEFELIARYFRPLAAIPEGLDLADDAALLAPRPGEEWVVTNDMLVEGIHFLDDPPASIARKALRVNLSDLAAKGAEPAFYLVGLGLTDRCDEAWVAGFAEGLAGDQAAYGIRLAGGDTVQAGELITLSVTAIGRLPAGKMVHRSGARPGDMVTVSGTLGDAALAVRIRLGQAGPAGLAAGHLLDRYLHPQPRVGLAAAIRRYATAAMDISDGLVGDLGHIAAASGVGAEIEAALVPLSDEARAFLPADPTALATILTGGDDYEVLATVPPADLPAYVEAAAAAGIPVTAIGRITAGRGPVVVRDRAGAAMALTRRSWVHR